MERIEHQGILLALVVSGETWPRGLSFLTSDDAWVQAGTWRYDAGKKLDAHRHLDEPRTALRTQELVFVRQGRLRVDIYDDDGGYLMARELRAGDIAILFAGGHGYEVLDDDTQVLEVKNGPFLGLERDKVRFPASP